MPSTVHILETALLILAAFLVGCVIGYLARRLTIPKPAAAVAEQPKVAVATGPQLVVAPTIAPIARPKPNAAERLAAAAAGSAAKQASDAMSAETSPADQAATEAVPSPSSEPGAAAPELAPAADAGVTISGGEIASAAPSEGEATPADAASSAPSVEPEPRTQPVRAEDVPPIDEAAHVVDQPMDATAEQAASLKTAAGSAGSDLLDDRLDVPAVPALPLDAAPPPRPVDASSDAVVLGPQNVDPPPQPDRPLSDTALPRFGEDAEAAAMRAIEGGWTPRAAVAPEQPAPEPELNRAEIEAAMASARVAVASAAAAAQAALAGATIDEPSVAEPPVEPAPELAFEVARTAGGENFLESAAVPALDGLDFEPERPVGGFGRPRGLPAPRDGGKDDLRQIRGLSPDIELALNQLGIFHYDQVAGWDRKATVWLDQHLGLHGRIGREKWIDQARALVRGRPQPARPVRR